MTEYVPPFFHMKTMHDSDRIFPIAVATLVEAGSDGNPELLFLAIDQQLEPVVCFLYKRTSRLNLEKVKWILTEIISNALTAPIGTSVIQQTGLPRNQLLEAFGTSVLWPHPALDYRSLSGPQHVYHKIESALGHSAADFIRLPLSEKFRLLGIPLSENWIRVIVNCAQETHDLEIIVESDHPPCDEDEAEIMNRFADPALKKAEISSLREKYVDEDGLYHLPSFTGGGGCGLLVCIEASADMRLHFDFLREGIPEGKTRFRIATYPLSVPKEGVRGDDPS